MPRRHEKVHVKLTILNHRWYFCDKLPQLVKLADRKVRNKPIVRNSARESARIIKSKRMGDAARIYKVRRQLPGVCLQHL